MKCGEADFLKVLVSQAPNHLIKMFQTIGYINKTVSLKILDQFKFLRKKCNNGFCVFHFAFILDHVIAFVSKI